MFFERVYDRNLSPPNDMISVCINTKNRPRQLLSCLERIKKNNYSDLEIIIVDQGKPVTSEFPEILCQQRIKYFTDKEASVGRAKNLAVSQARGEIIVFTDDDCLVEENWLRKIRRAFAENKEIVGLFGQVKPDKPAENKGKICPCSFTGKQKKLISKPGLHWKEIGFGNNMAFRKDVFKKSGGFKNWLGPGSIGRAAEDGELALRVLLKGYKILYEPEIIVYHHRWLTKDEYRRQCLSYSCGEVACYGFFALKGYKFAKPVVLNNFKDSYRKFKEALRALFSFKRGSFKLFLSFLEELFFRLRGLTAALWYARKEPI